MLYLGILSAILGFGLVCLVAPKIRASRFEHLYQWARFPGFFLTGLGGFLISKGLPNPQVIIPYVIGALILTLIALTYLYLKLR